MFKLQRDVPRRTQDTQLKKLENGLQVNIGTN